MRVFYSDRFNLDLPPGHRFPGQKYRMLREALLRAGVLEASELAPSPMIEEAALRRAHADTYVDAMGDGSIDPGAMRRIGFPWSPVIDQRARATVGGACAAAHMALAHGISGQLAGGTHHAHYDFGAGFCVYNDFAVAALDLLAHGLADRIAIIDLDVHQGDGNAAILTARADMFVYSVHGAKNFPFRKVASDLDVPLPDGTGDGPYLRALADTLPAVFDFAPDIVLYQAGVDPLAADRLGRFTLTHDGLMQRDRMVFEACRSRGIPVSIAIGGGYADPIEASVTAYVNTWRVAKEVYRRA